MVVLDVMAGGGELKGCLYDLTKDWTAFSFAIDRNALLELGTIISSLKDGVCKCKGQGQGQRCELEELHCCC